MILGVLALQGDFKDHIRSFSKLGIKTLEVDGHNLNELISTFENSKKMGELNCILAKTIKGKGCKLMEHEKRWHYYNSMTNEEIEQARKELS